MKLILSVQHILHGVKELSERQQAVLDNASDVICSFDLTGRCISINRASLRLWGYDPVSLVGTNLFEIIAPQDRELLAGNVRSVYVKTIPGVYELKVHRNDGTIADTSWSLYWSREHNWIVAVVYDITARKKAERRESEFTAMVSHDLRSPLSTIQMFMQGLELELWGNISNEIRINTSKSKKLIDRLIVLTNEILFYEKIGHRDFALEFSEFALKDLLDDATYEVSGHAKQKNIEVNSQPTDLAMHGDRVKLLRVVSNLLTNAIKYSPDGKKVFIAVSDDTESVVLKVIDQGIGVSDENKTTIFEKFKQSHGSTNLEGVGLGLAICKTIVEKHGGRIGVADASKGGCIFWVKLPKQPVPKTV